MIDAATKRLVRQRAHQSGEYRGLHQNHSPLAALQIEPINPKKHGGSDEGENLALDCIDCNLAKSSNIAERDPETSQLTLLINPRQNRWDNHFERDGVHIVGLPSVALRFPF